MRGTNTLIGLALDDLDGEYIDPGWYVITERRAKKLNKGRLPRPGYEACVQHLGVWFWLARTRHHGEIVWSVRDSRGWHVVDNGTALLSTPGTEAAARIYDRIPEPVTHGT